MSGTNNKTFFLKAKAGEMGYRDIFSDVFKRHTEEDTAQVFIAGTSLTTPDRANMLAEWIKPFLFARLFAVGVLASVLLYVFFKMTLSQVALEMFLIIVPSLMPLTMLLMAWEMNIPRNISLYELLKIVVFGGILSLLCTDLLNARFSEMPAYMAPLTEEPAKLALVCLFLGRRKKGRSYILNGILIGFAVGTGFALMESIGYSFDTLIFNKNTGVKVTQNDLLSAHYGMQTAVVRLCHGTVGHGVYAALYGGAIAMVKKDDALSVSHLVQPSVLFYFAAACLLHALHNSKLVFNNFDILGVLSIQYLLIILPLGLFLLLPLLRKGVNQIVEITVQENGSLTSAVNAASGIAGQNPVLSGADSRTSASWYLQGVSGELAGRRIALNEGTVLRVGRDASRASLVLNSSPKVSGLHCELRFQAGRLSVRDLGSTNGTIVDARKIPAQIETEVFEGSTVYLGDSTCGLRLVREVRR